MFTTMTPSAPWAKKQKGVIHPPFCLYLVAKRYWFCFPIVWPVWLMFLYPISWLNYKLIKRKVKRLKPDLILNHGDNQIAAILSRIGHELGIPVVTIFHTAYWVYLASEAKNPKVRDFLIRCQNQNSHYVYNHSDAVIMLSEWFAREYFRLIHAGDDRRFILTNVVPTCDDIDESQKKAFLSEIRTILPFFGTDPIITLVGRIEDYKNLQFAIQVLHQYHQRSQADPSYGKVPHLVFIGEGSYQKALEELADSLGINHLLHFLGYKPYTWTRKFIRWATNVLCATSLSESDGLTPKDARIEGCPALVPSGTSMAENSPPGYALQMDPEDWAYAIEALINMSSTNRERLSRQLSHDEQIRNDPEVYIHKLLDIIGFAIRKCQERLAA